MIELLTAIMENELVLRVGVSFIVTDTDGHVQWGERWRARRAPGIFCDPCPTGGLLPLICWATLYGFAPGPPGHQQMF